MKRILVLSQFFYPDKTATGKILAELFEGIAKEDFQVDVISSRQEYGANVSEPLPTYEEWSNMRIFRCFRFFQSKDSSFGRIFNYIMVFLLTAFTCFHHGLHRKKDCIVTVSNPPIMPILGALLKNNHRKFVYILHDLYPDIAVAMGVVTERHLFARFMRWANKYSFNHADRIIVLGRDMKKHLIDAYKIPANKITVITNWATKDFYQPIEKKEMFRIVYTGNLGKFHDLGIAVEALKRLNNVELFFIGEGASKQLLQEMSKNVAHVYFLPFLAMKEYEQMLSSADALLVSLEQHLSGLAVPSKFYTYLSSGRPIICVSDRTTEMAMIISEYNCGFVINHGDVDGFVNEVEKIRDDIDLRYHIGKNAHDLYLKYYQKSAIVQAYKKIFDSMLD